MFNLFLAEVQAPGAFQSLWAFLLVIVVFYFFLIRPQTKRQKELRKFREALKKGDKVVTTGGIYGKITEIKDNNVSVEIAKDVIIKIDKSAIIMDMTDVAQK